MTQMENAMVAIAATLSTLAETGGAPETMIYLGACNMDYGFWQTIRTLMLQSGLIKISANYVTLTPEGRKTAEKIDKLLPKQ